VKRSIITFGMVAAFVQGSLLLGEEPASQRTWLNPPRTWSDSKGRISLSAEGKTDFWRLGAVADNGHFYFEEREGDFTVTVKLRADFAAQYDQAGLMIRIDEKTWIKTGVELLDGREVVATVVTREFSDGSVVPEKEALKPVWLKLARKGDFVQVHYSLDNRSFQVVRTAYFPPKVACKVGVMAAAPLGAGFQAAFEDLEITAAQ
jgi:regulation of enolase protein 1 (concanavalin A-like superfamily)